MEKLLLDNIKRSVKSASFPLPNKSLSYLLYTCRYHHTLPRAYTSSLFSLLCKKMEKTPPSSESYINGLINLCKFGSLRKLDDLLIFKFKEYFLKCERACSWNEIKTISSFLNHAKINDPECLDHYNKLFYETILNLKGEEKRAKYYLYALRAFFKNEDYNKEKVQMIFNKYAVFKENMSLLQKVDIILLLKNTEDHDILEVYAKFIEENGIMDEVQENLKEISLEKISNLWNKCITLKIFKPNLFNYFKVEILERKNYLTENNLYTLVRVLRDSTDLPLEEKKRLAQILKQTFKEKIENKSFDLKRYYEQTSFLLFLKNMELITSEEIEKFYFESFFLNPDPKMFKLTITNMVNLSQQNYAKMKKFLLWNISQILTNIDQISANKVYEMLIILKDFMKIPNEILASFDLYVNNKLKRLAMNQLVIAEEKNNGTDEIIERFSLISLQIFLKKEIKNLDSNKEFNQAFKELMEKLKLYENLVQIPMNREFFSWLDEKNKEALTSFIENNFNKFYSNEKLTIIENFYGVSLESDKIFVKELQSQINDFSSDELCRFYWIFVRNSDCFPLKEIKVKIFSQILTIPQIDCLMNSLENLKTSSEFITNIQKSMMKFENCFKNDNLNFYSIIPVIKIFKKKNLFTKDFLEGLKQKVLKGDFGSTEFSMNDLFKIWA